MGQRAIASAEPVEQVDRPSTSGRDAEQAKKAKKPPSIVSAVSGAVSGALIGACVQPLDVVRTKMQGDAAKGITRGTMATCMEIAKHSGVRGFWQGTGPSVWRVGVGVGVHMVLVENMKGALMQTLSSGAVHLSSVNAAIAGAAARAVAATLLCPITVVKTRMEYVSSAPDAIKYKNTAHALATIARTEGAGGLFRGLVPTILTNAPFSGLYYMFYTRLKEKLAEEGRPQVLVNFTSGVVAAVAATFVTQPFDVVRTRIQLSRAAGVTGVALSPMASLRSAFQQQGASALLVGLTPRVLKRTSQTALVWTLYEELLPRLTGLYAAALAKATTAAGPGQASSA